MLASILHASRPHTYANVIWLLWCLYFVFLWTRDYGNLHDNMYHVSSHLMVLKIPHTTVPTWLSKVISFLRNRSIDHEWSRWTGFEQCCQRDFFPRPRPFGQDQDQDPRLWLQDQNEDFYLKTKTKTKTFTSRPCLFVSLIYGTIRHPLPKWW